MRILHIITGLNNGGAEAVLYRLVTNDNQNIHQVIALMDKGLYGERLTNSGIPVYALNMPKSWMTIKGIVQLFHLMRSIKPDVVQTWMYHADLLGGIVARFAGVKIVVWGIRGPFDRRRTKLSTKITIYLCALFSRFIPRVIVSNSVHAAKVHVKTGYSSHKLVNIPNGYLFEQFQPDETARDMVLHEFNLKRDVVLLGMVARFDPYKDHENLFAALLAIAQRGRQAICLLVGSGMNNSNEYVVQLVRKYGIEAMVKLIGPLDDIPKIMSALNLHVLSSAAESFPNVLAEAMACGTPCVTTDVGDAALIIGDTGWIVPRSDPIALADAIIGAMEEMKNYDKWNARRVACRKHIIENYSLETMIKKYNRVWNDAIVNK